MSVGSSETRDESGLARQSASATARTGSATDGGGAATPTAD